MKSLQGHPEKFIKKQFLRQRSDGVRDVYKGMVLPVLLVLLALLVLQVLPALPMLT